MNTALTSEQVTEAVQKAVLPLNDKIDRLMQRQLDLEERLSAFIAELIARLEDEQKDSQFQELLGEFIGTMKVMNQRMEEGQEVEKQLIRAMDTFAAMVDASLELPES